jgi:hypothetical protein
MYLPTNYIRSQTALTGAANIYHSKEPGMPRTFSEIAANLNGINEMLHWSMWYYWK